MTFTTSYTLGSSHNFPSCSKAIVWANKGGIEGIKMYARNEKTGQYVRVYEVGPTEWVDNEPQAWSTGNFEDLETAKKFGHKAYRFLNR
jgi:hypothetical protein